MKISALMRPILLLRPDLPNIKSAWLSHIPFAFWLVDTVKPKIIVELGVHEGGSYLSFCQAVRETGCATKCYGIDHWQGDEHAGDYACDVLANLKAFHDPRYLSFSTLIKSSFQEAINNFEDESIDILHIDGLHTYESVKQDYELWLPKLSSKAIVLFHDTQVMTGNFGVHKLWSEVSAHTPHFEFEHGYGLGVLCYGCDAAVDLKLILSKDIHGPAKTLFSMLGNNIAKQYIFETPEGARKKLRKLMASKAPWLLACIRYLRDCLSGFAGRKNISSALNETSNNITLSDSLTPEDGFKSVGDGDPDAVGLEFLLYSVVLSGVSPSDKILEIGCGTGRIAKYFSEFLTEGSYHGVDVVKAAVQWCDKAYIEHKNFKFSHLDVYNKFYNKDGLQLSSDFRFNFDDESFDFIYLTSVFTHMLPNDVALYLDEVQRLLKKGGRCLMTFFLLNDESLACISNGVSRLDFFSPVKGSPGCLTIDSDCPEAAIAYPEHHVLNLLSSRGLKIQNPISSGEWCGRKKWLSFQDLIVVTKM